jgi:uncharacterized membrane protein YjgN (DUF898 family)
MSTVRYARVQTHFTAKTVLSNPGSQIGSLGFDGSIGKGFGLIWGQSLLSLITLGVYIPWGSAKIGRWLLGSSYYQSNA